MFENLNSISNVFQEPHYFLIFIDLVAIYISSRISLPKLLCKNTDESFSDQGTFILKFTEIGFGQLIKYSRGPFFADFCCR